MAGLVDMLVGDLLLILASEKKLETHDIAIPLPQLSQHAQKQFLRIILLSSEDMKDFPHVMDRIERLYHHAGGRYVGIFFLLGDVTSQENGLRSFMKLQAECVYFSM